MKLKVTLDKCANKMIVSIIMNGIIWMVWLRGIMHEKMRSLCTGSHLTVFSNWHGMNCIHDQYCHIDAPMSWMWSYFYISDRFLFSFLIHIIMSYGHHDVSSLSLPFFFHLFLFLFLSHKISPSTSIHISLRSSISLVKKIPLINSVFSFLFLNWITCIDLHRLSFCCTKVTDFYNLYIINIFFACLIFGVFS